MSHNAKRLAGLVGLGLSGLTLAAAGPAAAVVGLPLTNAYFIYTTEAANVDTLTGLPVPLGSAVIYQNDRTYKPNDGHSQITGLTTPTTATSTSISQNSDRGLSIRATAVAAPDLGTTNRSFAMAETNLIFYLEISGPAGTYVPVDMKAKFIQSGQTDPNPANDLGIWGQATAFGQIEIGALGGSGGGSDIGVGSGSGSDFYIFDTCPFPGCTGSFTTSLNQVLELQTNTVYQVDEAVLANAAVFATGAQLTSTIVGDPTFTILKGYQDAHPDVTLGASGNVAPAVTVPEPAGWALMLVGVGLSGAALRRRRALAPVRI